jgi:hypothetical protein
MDGYLLPDYPALKRLNGIDIRSLGHFVQVLHGLTDQYLVFEWYDRGVGTLVLDRATTLAMTLDVLTEYSIRDQASPDMQAVWEGRTQP